MTLTTPIVDPLGPEGAVASALARSVEPFVTASSGYDTVLLNWTSPAAASWLGIQIVRSRSGYPRLVNDGVLVLNYQHPGWNEENSYTVSGLTGGYHYFSLFLKDAFGWQRVATKDALVPYDYSSTDLLWDTLPEHYRVVRDNTADVSLVNLRINPDLYDGVAGGEQPNLLLSAYLSLFGWSLDMLRTQVEYVRNGYDPTVVHTSRLDLLAKQFGHTLETSVPAHVNRTIVRNISTLYRERGTLEGIKDTLTAVSGWDVEVTLGPNMLLSEDQSAHTNPPQLWSWDPTVRYAATDIVRYGDYIYEAVSPNANTPPPATATSNATWTYYAYPLRRLGAERPETGDINTWQVRQSDVGPIAGRTAQVWGAPDITGTKFHSSAMRIAQYTGAISWMEVESVPAITNPVRPARANILEAGIPIPRPVKWRVDRLYRAGEFAVYKGAAYEALNDVTGIEPTSTSDWVRVGVDDRIMFTASMYAHGPFVGTAGTGGKLITPKSYSYLADGTVSQSFEYGASTVVPVFDALVDDEVLNAGGRTANGYTWVSDGGNTWTISRDDNGGKVTPPATGTRSQRYFNVPWSVLNIAVTWTDDPGTTRVTGIIFRGSTVGNYWIASQTGLFKVVGGAARANPASGALSWTKFTAGQRMRVFLNGDSISVYRNGSLLGTATDSFNNTATNHGLGTEA